MRDEISNFIDLYRRFKEDHRSPEEISYLVSILQEIADLENYKNKLAEVIKKYERDHRISM